MATLGDRLNIAALRLLPRNLMSRIAGQAAAIRWPRSLRRPLWRGFGWLAGVDFTEVRDPLTSFPALQDFFVRHLADGVREVDPAADALVSPCDGAWGQCGEVRNGQLLQIKGRPYSLQDLLGDASQAQSFEGGAFATLYLSPKDYHRFHIPCPARLDQIRYLPGSLWPVNRAGVELVDGLFAENERICAFFDLAAAGGYGRLCLVAVGATIVGKIRLTFDDVESNLPDAKQVDRTYEPPLDFEKGAEWGRFHFGSTLVLIATPDALSLDPQPLGTPLRLGRRIGTLSTS